MPPTPLYTRDNLGPPAYQLRFSWACWPSSGTFPDPPGRDVFDALEAAWEEDGIRKLESKWTPEQIQLTVSVKPSVSPVFLARRLKGRLDHALRLAGTPVKFSRKLSVRSLGDVRSSAVEEYIKNQIEKEGFVDPAVEQFLTQFTVENPSVDLTAPTESNSGRYWYNLHLVLVVQERGRIFDPQRLTTLRDSCLKIAQAKGYGISMESIVPDHLHLALRGNIEHSAEQIALAFLNNLAYAVGQVPLWEYGYYAGTFGEYDMGSVRL
jgi:REP element-mobilizing transposase RayT